MPRSIEYAERFRELRQRLGLTQRQLADGIGVKEHQITAVERGLTTPSVWILAAIASMYEIDAKWLLLGPDPEPPGQPDIILPRDIREIGNMMRWTLRLVLDMRAMLRDALEAQGLWPEPKPAPTQDLEEKEGQ